MEKLLYENSFIGANVLKDFIFEGNVCVEYTKDGVVLSNGDSESKGDFAHWTIWLDKIFEDNIQIEWEFKPLREPGLCMIFFAAKGINGESIFDSTLKSRNGYYPQYHSSDINAYHISYFRHKYASERAFRTCNLRKSAGFNFVCQGADPLPPTEDATDFYKIKVKKHQNIITFYINDLQIFEYKDDGKTYGKVLQDGYIGFRQMAPMKAIYRNLKVIAIRE